MAKKLTNREKVFSFSDLAVAGQISKRAVQMLVDANILPEGKAVNVLKRVSAIGGFYGAGVPLIAAAKMASAILEEFNEYDGEVPTGLSFMARGALQDLALETPVDRDDYDYHKLIVERPEHYQAGEAKPSDALIEIVDRQFVYLGNKKGQSTMGSHASDGVYTYSCRIENWERGSDITVVSGNDEFVFDSEHPDFQNSENRRKELEGEIRNNAVGKITVNISLAIRNGFDRLADHRNKKWKRKPN